MKPILFAAAAAVLFSVTPALAQGPAYPTPDNNLTRTDDVDPADAPNMNLEYGQPTDDDVVVAPDPGPDVVIEPPLASEVYPE